MLVTFGNKRVNTGFVQIFGSKRLWPAFFPKQNFFFQTQGYQIGAICRQGPEDLVG